MHTPLYAFDRGRLIPMVREVLSDLYVRTLTVVVSLAFLSPASPSYALEGTVISVSDGDTIIVRAEDGPKTIRLYGLDAPERYQPFGARAKRYLADVVRGKTVYAEVVDTDEYERSVALVRLEDGRLVNEELIRAGVAWVYRWYCRKRLCLQWIQLEDQARKNGQGLWKDTNPIPPWEWRETHREKR